ncbi:hypothetical protein GF367_03800, partial [Candidatus Woesearchaeota archaeon]|nr:hypothetical protein [Candidatus Woesearchaeota archaeon]
MELSKFLQQDIIEFLDKKGSEQRERGGSVRAEEFSLFDLKRDYAKDVAGALEENNLAKAKHIFDDLREAYNSLAGREEEREKVYAVLKEVYAKIKESVEQGKTLEEDFKEFERGLKSTAAGKDRDSAAFEQAAGKAQQERERLEEQLQASIDAINAAVKHEDTEAAIKEYGRLKERFKQYPGDDKFRKINWYNQVLGTYEQINKLRKKLKEKEGQQQREAAKAEKQRQAQQREARARKAQLDHARTFVKRLINSLDGKDTHTMEDLLIESRHKVAKLDDRLGEDKQTLESLLSLITKRIQ